MLKRVFLTVLLLASGALAPVACVRVHDKNDTDNKPQVQIGSGDSKIEVNK